MRTQWSSPGPIHPPQALWPRQQAQPGAAPCSRPAPCPAHCLEVLLLPEGLSGLPPGHASSLALLSGHGASGAEPTLAWCPLNQCWSRASPGSWAQEIPARPLPHSLPACRGQPGSPGPADKCLGQHRTGQLGPRMQRPCKQSRCPRHGARQGGGVSGQHLNQLPDSRSQIQSNLVRVSEKVI